MVCLRRTVCASARIEALAPYTVCHDKLVMQKDGNGRCVNLPTLLFLRHIMKSMR